jgi:hypothetical protein
LIVDCLCRHHRSAAAALFTVVLPPMTLSCLRVAKLATATALLPSPTPPRYPRYRRSRATAATALSPSPPAALPPRSPRRRRHCQAAKLAPTSMLLLPLPLR